MRVVKFVFGGALLGVTSALVAATSVSAQENGSAGGSDSPIDTSRVVVAAVFIVAAIAVIAIGLYFAYGYHQRLLRSIDTAVQYGATGPISTSNEDSLAPRPRSMSVVGATGPPSVEVGQNVTYEATGTTEPSTVTWSIEGGGPTPSGGQGASISVTFSQAGTAVVTPTQEGLESVPLTVTVVARPAASSREGVVLPFVIRNWARFVVVIFGVGAISALMALSVISAEGGIGLLGALLGIGGAAANSDGDSKPSGGGPEGAT